jgi:hypothetical protein
MISLSRRRSRLAPLIGGFRVAVAFDAVCSSADETHDAIVTIYLSRFGEQIDIPSVNDILGGWA